LFMKTDQRRWFAPSEVTAAWLRQDRRCVHCHRILPRDLIEGDHIIPWINGGPTTMDNLHALCVACNRRKGNRESPPYIPPETRDIRPGSGKLRDWQSRALKAFADTTGPFLVEACPGAGKTRFALEAAYALFASGEVNRLLIAAPTIRVVQQWVHAANGIGGAPQLPLTPATWRPTVPIYENLCGAAFTWASLTSNTTQMEALAAEPGYKTLVVLDEVHHAGVGHTFGLAAQQAFNAAAHRVLSLTGTAFRSTDPIVFVHHEGRVALPDFSYTYGDALRDGSCRPVRFVQISGTTTFQTPDQRVHEVSFDDDLTERGESYRLRTALDASGNLLPFMIRQANTDLVRLRGSSDADAGGLIVCMDCDHADAVADILTRMTGTRPVVAYSRLNDANDLGGAAAIDAFTQSSDPWLVSVAMVSEGVDIRRLRSLVYATNVLAELSFRQIVGRVVRSDPANGGRDFGVVYLPADPRLMDMASNITGSSQVKLPDPIVITDRKEQEIVRVFEDGDVSRGEFRPIGSEGRRGMVTDVTGRQVPAHLVELAERYIKATGSDLPAFEMALLASTDDRLLKRLTAMGPTVRNSDDEPG
jgi:superfamily II DNA or RNA helicase